MISDAYLPRNLVGLRDAYRSFKDAFDLWWAWADKPVDNKPTIDAAIYDAVMGLPPDERRDRAKVNEAVREGIGLGPLRPAGSADLHGVPKATE